MVPKESTTRTKERRQREKEMGMERLDVSLHKATLRMLLELVKAAGYKVKSREKSRGINGVLAQLICEGYLRKDTEDWNKTEQQGFILARKLQTLRNKKFEANAAGKYVEAEKPSDYLDTEDAEWSEETLLQLLKEYRYAFAPKRRSTKKKVGKSHGKGDSEGEEYVSILND